MAKGADKGLLAKACSGENTGGTAGLKDVFSHLIRSLLPFMALFICSCAEPQQNEVEAPAPPTHPFDQTVTYAGTIPCEDCEQVDIVLNLRADEIYQLRKTSLGEDGNVNIASQLGTYQYLAEDNLIILGKQKGLLKTYALEPGALRFVEWQGATTGEQIQYRLLKTEEADPFTDAFKMRGLFSLDDRGPLFTLCGSKTSFRVAQNGDYPNLLQTYLNTPHTSGSPLLTTFIGKIRGGVAEEIQVLRFRRIYPDRRCSGEKQRSSLTGTIWHLIELDGVTMEAEGARGSSYLLLDQDKTFEASTGCNLLRGDFLVKGETLLLNRALDIRLACPTGLALENKFIELLEAVEAFRQEDEILSLLDGGEGVRARFKAGP